MLHSLSSVFSLFRHRSIAIYLLPFASSNHLSSLPEPTHLRSFINFHNLSSGYLGQYPLYQRFTLQHSMASQSSAQSKSVYDFVVKDARGNDVDLSTYKGKVLLIVNVASQCGLTNSNYPELTALYGKYKDKGFEVLAFPCNQFGNQEPGSNEEIVEFACTRFKAEYPIFNKVEVNGSNAAPLYKFLKSSKGGLLGDGIKWNFTKFLVDKEGNVVDRYAPTTSPSSIEKDIKKLLGIS
ncbi:probable phospholipid hydroperoxide glutathione peroxidase [Beta vulgaris subsp. vulgaris]|nr:probable phospholipid hydroperoxide glutathione peroxidase [Beta vulgaris subsp. vulgaris]